VNLNVAFFYAMGLWKSRSIKILVSTVITVWFAVVAGVAVQAAPASSPQSVAYVLQADQLSEDRAFVVRQLAACGRDWIVLDPWFNGSEHGSWSKKEIDAIRAGKTGRKVLAYLSIAEAEDYRPYWEKEWDGNQDGTPDYGAPEFLLPENPDWQGNYRVRYWYQNWQRLVLDSLNSIVAQGFDGVYLDIVDAFQFFEYDTAKRDWVDNRLNEDTGNTFREDMIQWIRFLASHARQLRSDFLVVPQNGTELLIDDDYVNIIDGIGVEDLFTDGDQFQNTDRVQSTVHNLDHMKSTEKPIVVIEYGQSKGARARSIAGVREHHFLLLLTDRELTTLGESLFF
jgi:cysteinyl-tRNA synthetase